MALSRVKCFAATCCFCNEQVKGHTGVFRSLIHDILHFLPSIQPFNDAFCSRRPPTECWTKQEIYIKIKALNSFAVESKDKSLKMFTNRKCRQTSFARVEKSLIILVWM